MTIRLEITAATHQEFIAALAPFAGLLGVQPAAPTIDAEPVEQAEEVRKPRGRKRQEQVTIDHDPNEGAKNDVRATTDGTAVAGEPADDGDAAESAAERVAGATGGDAKDEPAAEVDAVAEAGGSDSAPADQPSMTIDEVRAYMINNYLNVVTDELPKRKELYKELLDQFSIEKIVDLSAEKIGAFKAAVDAKIAAVVKA